jgi:uncharacterized protein
MHLVRLQRMGYEALRTGRLNVTRTDREELLAIRDGLWSYDELEAQASSADAEIAAARATSPLPETPDDAFLDDLCVNIVEAEL